MRLSQHQSKFTYDKAKFIFYAYDMGFQLTDGEAYRTADQQYLYFNGKKIGNKGILEDVPVASWTMNSMHLKRLAQDFNFFKVLADGTTELTNDYETLKPLGEYWERLDPLNKWGGFWLKSNGKPGRDCPHIQHTVK